MGNEGLNTMQTKRETRFYNTSSFLRLIGGERENFLKRKMSLLGYEPSENKGNCELKRETNSFGGRILRIFFRTGGENYVV